MSVKFLRSGAFDAQGIVTVPTVRLMNRLGTLTTEQIRSVEKECVRGSVSTSRHNRRIHTGARKDAALKGIEQSYGEATAAFVALQLEYARP